MKMVFCTSLMSLIVSLVFVAHSFAVATTLTVRAKSHDGKFVGSSVGDVQVTVKDFNSREVLASGFISGGTGDTKNIMKTDRKRDSILSDETTAAFVTQLEINKPQKLLVEIDGPLSAGLSAHHAAQTTWLIPGHDIVDDGLLFEMYGLIVRNYHPLPPENVIIGEPAKIGAHVTLMCGCPTRPGFLWDSANFTIKAIIEKDGEFVAELPLEYTGTLSNFEAEYTFPSGGYYKVTTIASDNKNNQGIDITTYTARSAEKFHSMNGTTAK